MDPHRNLVGGAIACSSIAFVVVDVLGISSIAGWLAVKRHSAGLALAGVSALAASVIFGIVGGVLAQGAWLGGVADRQGRNAAPGCAVMLGAFYATPIAFLCGMAGGRVAGARTWKGPPRGDDPILLMNAASGEEAMVLQSLLKAESIPAFYRGVEVFVPRERLEEAQKLVQSSRDEKHSDA